MSGPTQSPLTVMPINSKIIGVSQCDMDCDILLHTPYSTCLASHYSVDDLQLQQIPILIVQLIKCISKIAQLNCRQVWTSM